MIMTQRQPNFENLLKVLRREKPERPVLFEIFMDKPVMEYFAGYTAEKENELEYLKMSIDAFKNAGYDYASTHGCKIGFKTNAHEGKSTTSKNEGAIITDDASFEAYEWPDVSKCDFSRLSKIKSYLPDGMKLMLMGMGGVLENVTSLVGYDNMCFMLFDNPTLLGKVFEMVGQTFYEYYKAALEYDSVGVVLLNDDWGFRTQTLISVADLRKYVFPWHKKIIDLAHDAGRPVILHSCGYANDIMEDIIAMGYDAKHSFEDNILPVEECFKRWGDRIAIMGGLDLEFLIRSPIEDVVPRAKALLDMTADRGGYALGTGNSFAFYIPRDKMEALINVALNY